MAIIPFAIKLFREGNTIPFFVGGNINPIIGNEAKRIDPFLFGLYNETSKAFGTYKRDEHLFFTTIAILKKDFDVFYNFDVSVDAYKENQRSTTTKNNHYIKIDIDKIFRYKAIVSMLDGHKVLNLLKSKGKLNNIIEKIDIYFNKNNKDTDGKNKWEKIKSILEQKELECDYIDKLYKIMVNGFDSDFNQILYLEKSPSGTGMHVVVKYDSSLDPKSLLAYYYKEIGKIAKGLQIPIEAFEFNPTQTTQKFMFRAGDKGIYNQNYTVMPAIHLIEKAHIDYIDKLGYINKVAYIKNNTDIVHKHIYLNYIRIQKRIYYKSNYDGISEKNKKILPLAYKNFHRSTNNNLIVDKADGLVNDTIRALISERLIDDVVSTKQDSFKYICPICFSKSNYIKFYENNIACNSHSATCRSNANCRKHRQKIKSFILQKHYKKNIKKKFNEDEYYGIKKIIFNGYIQDKQIVDILSEQYKNVQIIAPTGAGKTTSILNWVVKENRPFIYIAPLTAIIKQVNKKLNLLKIDNLIIDKNISKKEAKKILTEKYLEATYNKFLTTPESLYKILENLECAQHLQGMVIIFDEAHNVVNQAGFRNYHKLMDFIKNNDGKYYKTISLTGTAFFTLEQGFETYKFINEYKKKNIKTYRILNNLDINHFTHLIYSLIQKQKILIVYIDDKKKIDEIKDLLITAYEVNDKKITILKSDNKKGKVFRQLTSKSTLQNYHLIFTTQVIAEGVNIQNTNIDYVISYKNKNIITVNQFLARFRTAKFDFIEILQDVYNVKNNINIVYELEKIQNNVINTSTYINKLISECKSKIEQSKTIPQWDFEFEPNFYMNLVNILNYQYKFANEHHLKYQLLSLYNNNIFTSIDMREQYVKCGLLDTYDMEIKTYNTQNKNRKVNCNEYNKLLSELNIISSDIKNIKKYNISYKKNVKEQIEKCKNDIYKIILDDLDNIVKTIYTDKPFSFVKKNIELKILNNELYAKLNKLISFCNNKKDIINKISVLYFKNFKHYKELFEGIPNLDNMSNDEILQCNEKRASRHLKIITVQAKNRDYVSVDEQESIDSNVNLAFFQNVMSSIRYKKVMVKNKTVQALDLTRMVKKLKKVGIYADNRQVLSCVREYYDVRVITTHIKNRRVRLYFIKDV